MGELPDFWTETAEGLILAVKALPGAKRVQIGPVVAAPEIPGWPAARLKVAVAAVPEAGRANVAIIRALADWLLIKESRLVQQAGMTARDKKFLVIEGRFCDFSRQFAAAANVG